MALISAQSQSTCQAYSRKRELLHLMMERKYPVLNTLIATNIRIIWFVHAVVARVLEAWGGNRRGNVPGGVK